MLEPTATRTLFYGLALVAVASIAIAQPGFSNDDLVGPYSFSSSGIGLIVVDSWSVPDGSNIEMIGFLEADGAGNVTGTRTFQRPIIVDVAPSTPVHQRREVVEQTVTGTYEVNADGSGTMWLSPEPNPAWSVPSQRATIVRFIGGGPEVLRFVLADDGRSFRFTHELRATRHAASVIRDTHLLLSGIAETQEPLELPEPEPDPRIDDLIDLLEGQDARIDDLAAQNDILKAQLCEILRLLNTPQGQRVSDSPEVVDACGTAFAWNAEGTDGPRRGR